MVKGTGRTWPRRAKTERRSAGFISAQSDTKAPLNWRKPSKPYQTGERGGGGLEFVYSSPRVSEAEAVINQRRANASVDDVENSRHDTSIR